VLDPVVKIKILLLLRRQSELLDFLAPSVAVALRCQVCLVAHSDPFLPHWNPSHGGSQFDSHP
jgi:hypothetical protein